MKLRNMQAAGALFFKLLLRVINIPLVVESGMVLKLLIVMGPRTDAAMNGRACSYRH